MAKLSSHALTLEVRFKNFKWGDVQYEIGFLWEEESMINDALLKLWSDYWQSRSKGYFLANEYEKDRLIETIEKALQTDAPAYWKSLDPDLIFAIYPKKFFPFLLEAHDEWIDEDDEAKPEQANQEKRPDDWFTVIAFIDAYNFQNSKAYLDSGIALHLLVTRRDVEDFCAKLKEEYGEFKEKFKVDEYKPEYVVHRVVDIENKLR